MGNLVDAKTGERTYVDDADMPAALASKKYLAPDAVAVQRFGQDTYVTPELQQQEGVVAPIISGAKAESARGHQMRSDENTGVLAEGKSLLGGAIGGVSGGLIDPFQDEQEFNRGASVLGTAIGAIAPGFIGDEAGFASLFREPAAAESAAAGLSSKFLLSGEAGAEAGTAGKLVEKGLARSADELANASKVGTEADLSSLDAKGLRAAHEAELDSLSASRDTGIINAKQSAVSDLAAYRNTVQGANPWLVVTDGEPAANLNKANRALRDALDTPESLARNPGVLLKPLEKEAQALKATIADRPAIEAKFEAVNSKIANTLDEELRTLPDAATHVELEGKAARRYASYSGVKVGSEGTIQVARDDASQFLDAIRNGDVRGEGQKSLDGLQGLLDQNTALRGKILDAVKPAAARGELTSDRLTAIGAARDALAQPKTKSLAEDMLGGTIMSHIAGAFSGMPIIGPMIGAKVGKLATEVVFGRMGKAAGEQAARSATAVKTFLGNAVMSPQLPVLATRVLSRAQYAPQRSELPDNPQLHDLYKARTDELKTQTAYGPDGKPVMRPDARQAMASKLAAIKALDPIGADNIETLAARRVEYLSSKIPRRPDFGGLPNGPDNWKPSDMAMRQFARYAAAVDDPGGVEERVAHGTVTVEDAEAYHAVYPERAQAFIQSIVSGLPNLKKPIPFSKRISLSIFAGIPVDPAMTPNILQVLQEGFAQEPDSKGGTTQPIASPQFGSVKKSVEMPTPSQKRFG